MGNMKKHKRHDKKKPGKGDNSKESSPSPSENLPKQQEVKPAATTTAAASEKAEVKVEKPVEKKVEKPVEKKVEKPVEKTSAEAPKPHEPPTTMSQEQQKVEAKPKVVEKKEQEKPKAEEKKEPEKPKAEEKKEPEKLKVVEKKEPEKPKVVEKKEQEKSKSSGRHGRRNETPRKTSNSSAGKPAFPPRTASDSSVVTQNRSEESRNDKDVPPRSNAPHRDDARGEEGNGARNQNSRFPRNNGKGHRGGRNRDGPPGGPRNGQGHHGQHDGRDSHASTEKNRPPASPEQRPVQFGAQDYRLTLQQSEGKPTAPPAAPPVATNYQMPCQDVRLDSVRQQRPADASNGPHTQSLNLEFRNGRYNGSSSHNGSHRGGYNDRRGPERRSYQNARDWADRSLTNDARRPPPIAPPRIARNSFSSQLSHTEFPPLMSFSQESKVNISQSSSEASKSVAEVSTSEIVLPKQDIVTPPLKDTIDETLKASSDREERPRKGESAADKDKNWRMLPGSDVPRLSVKQLLSPKQKTPVVKKGEMVFSGSVSSLDLPPQQVTAEAPVAEVGDVKGSKAYLKNLIQGLPLVIDPLLRRHGTHGFVDVTEDVKDAVRRMAKIDKSDAEEILAECGGALLQNSLVWMNRSFFMKCGSVGFAATDFIDDEMPGINEDKKFNWNEEFDMQIKWLERLVSAKFFSQEESQEVICKLTEIQELAKFADEENVEEMAKRNIRYVLADPITRLRFDKPISEDEMHAIVHRSVLDDCGSYIWIAENAPSKLLGSARIVESIILGISMKRVSKDQRPCAAFYKVVPQILKSLKEEELIELADKFTGAVETKVDNWPEMLFQGYQMNLSTREARNLRARDIVAIKLQECEEKEDLRVFLLACALIADFGAGRVAPVYDFSTDPFCTRLARVLLAPYISPEKKATLIEVLMSLPVAIKSRLLAEDGFPEDTSLYFTVKAMITTTANIPHAEFKKAAGHVIQELTKTISAARIISYAILPCLNEAANRQRAAAILPDLLKCDNLKQDLIEGKHLTPAVLVEAALAQYEEPKGGARGNRYAFIENILGCIDDVLEGDVAKEMINDVETILKKHLLWHQYLVILHVGFKKSGEKFALPEIPAVEDTLDSIRQLNMTAILGAWPDRDVVHGAFEKAIKVILLATDPAKLAFVWLAAVCAEDSTIKEYDAFLKRCLLEMVEKKEGATDAAKEGEEKAEDTAKEEKGEEAAKEEGEEAPATWLTEEMTKEGIDEKIRDFVLDLAVKLPAYSKEGAELAKELKPVPEEEPPVVAAVETSADPDNSSAEPTTAEVTVQGICGIVLRVDMKGTPYEELPAVDTHGNPRGVIWINESIAYRQSNFRHNLKTKLASAHIKSTTTRVGGGNPKPPKFLPKGSTREPHYLPKLPLFVEIVAYDNGKDDRHVLLESGALMVIIILQELARDSPPGKPCREYTNQHDGQDCHMFELPGVTDDDYEKEVGSNKDHHDMQKLLKCRINTVNRRPYSYGADWKRTEPICVRVSGAPEKLLKSAEKFMKKMFGVNQ